MSEKTILIKYNEEVLPFLNEKHIEFEVEDFLKPPKPSDEMPKFKSLEIQINESFHRILNNMALVCGKSIDSLINMIIEEYLRIMKGEPLSCLEDLFGQLNILEVFDTIVLSLQKIKKE